MCERHLQRIANTLPWAFLPVLRRNFQICTEFHRRQFSVSCHSSTEFQSHFIHLAVFKADVLPFGQSIKAAFSFLYLVAAFVYITFLTVNSQLFIIGTNGMLFHRHGISREGEGEWERERKAGKQMD